MNINHICKIIEYLLLKEEKLSFYYIIYFNVLMRLLVNIDSTFVKDLILNLAL